MGTEKALMGTEVFVVYLHSGVSVPLLQEGLGCPCIGRRSLWQRTELHKRWVEFLLTSA